VGPRDPAPPRSQAHARPRRPRRHSYALKAVCTLQRCPMQLCVDAFNWDKKRRRWVHGVWAAWVTSPRPRRLAAAATARGPGLQGCCLPCLGHPNGQTQQHQHPSKRIPPWPNELFSSSSSKPTAPATIPTPCLPSYLPSAFGDRPYQPSPPPFEILAGLPNRHHECLPPRSPILQPNRDKMRWRGAKQANSAVLAGPGMGLWQAHHAGRAVAQEPAPPGQGHPGAGPAAG